MKGFCVAVLVALVCMTKGAPPAHTLTATGCDVNGMHVVFGKQFSITQAGGCGIYRCANSGLEEVVFENDKCAMSDGRCHSLRQKIYLPDAICECPAVGKIQCVGIPVYQEQFVPPGK